MAKLPKHWNTKRLGRDQVPVPPNSKQLQGSCPQAPVIEKLMKLIVRYYAAI